MLQFITTASMLVLAAAPLRAFDEPPEPLEQPAVEFRGAGQKMRLQPVQKNAPAIEAPAPPEPSLPEPAPPEPVVEPAPPGAVAYPLHLDDLDVAPEPENSDAWRSRRDLAADDVAAGRKSSRRRQPPAPRTHPPEIDSRGVFLNDISPVRPPGCESPGCEPDSFDSPHGDLPPGVYMEGVSASGCGVRGELQCPSCGIGPGLPTNQPADHVHAELIRGEVAPVMPGYVAGFHAPGFPPPGFHAPGYHEDGFNRREPHGPGYPRAEAAFPHFAATVPPHFREHAGRPHVPAHHAHPHDAHPHDAHPHDAHPHDAHPHDAHPHDAHPHDARFDVRTFADDRAGAHSAEPLSYVTLKQEYELLWTRKIETALSFIPEVRVSVNVETGDHAGHVARVVRFEQGRPHEGGGVATEHSEHVHREIARPVVTGVCVNVPGHYAGASHHAAYRLHTGITPVLHPGHESPYADVAQVREIVNALLPPDNDTTVVVTHYHPSPSTSAGGAPLASAAAAPGSTTPGSAGVFLLIGIAICALTAIAVAGGMRASRQPQPAVADSVPFRPAATEERRAA